MINNESGWYEGWMIHDLVVPEVAPPRKGGHAQFGKITAADAPRLKKMGTGNNVPGNIFTLDGKAPHFPSPFNHFPDAQTNAPFRMGRSGNFLPSFPALGPKV